MDTNKTMQDPFAESVEMRASKCKLSPLPSPDWRCEEVSVPGMWVFDNLGFVADNYPMGISQNLDNLLEVRAMSYFDEKGRLMRYELWRIHQYDKKYWHLAYEGVYTYGQDTAEQAYWDETVGKAKTVTHRLDANGLLVADGAIQYPPFNLPFGHAIVPKHAPDSTWKSIKESYVSDYGNHKCMNIVYLGDSNEFRRFERWLCDDSGNPYMLMREEHVEIKENGDRYRWNSRGGYLIDWTMGPVYLTDDGKELPQKKEKFAFLKRLFK